MSLNRNIVLFRHIRNKVWSGQSEVSYVWRKSLFTLTYSKFLGWRSTRRTSEMDPMFQRCDGNHFCVCFFVLQPRFMGRCDTKSTKRILSAFQKHLEQSVVENNFSDSFSQQTRLVKFIFKLIFMQAFKQYIFLNAILNIRLG